MTTMGAEGASYNHLRADDKRNDVDGSKATTTTTTVIDDGARRSPGVLYACTLCNPDGWMDFQQLQGHLFDDPGHDRNEKKCLAAANRRRRTTLWNAMFAKKTEEKMLKVKFAQTNDEKLYKRCKKNAVGAAPPLLP